MNTVLSLDSVLRSDTGELLIEGVLVYRAFKVVGRVTILSPMDRARTEVWLAMHRILDYDDIIDDSVVVDPDEPLRFRQMSVARQKGTVNLYVDGDPGMIAEAMRRGMPTLLFSTPKYVRPEFRPDAPKGVRKWDELIDERNRQQAMLAVDARTKSSNELANFE